MIAADITCMPLRVEAIYGAERNEQYVRLLTDVREEFATLALVDLGQIVADAVPRWSGAMDDEQLCATSRALPGGGGSLDLKAHVERLWGLCSWIVEAVGGALHGLAKAHATGAADEVRLCREIIEHGFDLWLSVRAGCGRVAGEAHAVAFYSAQFAADAVREMFGSAAVRGRMPADVRELLKDHHDQCSGHGPMSECLATGGHHVH